MRLVVNRIASYRRSRVNNYVVDSKRPISRSVESVPLERERDFLRNDNDVDCPDVESTNY